MSREKSGPRVRFVTKRRPHHSTHSGYDRIVHYLRRRAHGRSTVTLDA